MTSTFEASTALDLGARGVFDGVAFALVGRTCVLGVRGALWNEWTLHFVDERRLYLVEAGDFILYEEASLIPSWDALVPGHAVDLGYVVVARGEARRVERWGLQENTPATYGYVDLSSRTGLKATIDFGETPKLFVGRPVSLVELGLTPHSAPVRYIPAPDVSRPKGVDVWLEVGDEGVLGTSVFRVVGMVSRSTDAQQWGEYLLHHAPDGLRWLVVSDGVWSLATPVEAGVVLESESAATVAGEGYELVMEGKARVDWASGELPWEVAIGEESNVREFATAESFLTKEWTAETVSWSRSIPVASDVIAKAFAKRALPKPRPR